MSTGQAEKQTLNEKASDIALSERIRVLRKRLNLSQQDIAARYGVAKSTWRRFESGDMPKGEVLAALALDGYNINWLLTGEGEMLRRDSEGLMRDAAEAAAIALVETDRNSARPLSETSLKTLFEDFYDGFNAAAESD